MNTKRQTVWLVSMLGLMVVLSAYYLFTDDRNELEMVADGNTGEGTVDVGGAAVGHGESDMDVLEIAEGVWEEWKTDDEILAEYEAIETGAYDDFTAMHMQRLERHAKEMEQQMAIINDVSSTDSAIDLALEEYSRLEMLQSKLTEVESQLMSEYENVFVTEHEGAWKVIVKADELQSSQAVSIIDLVTGELDVHASNVQVEYR